MLGAALAGAAACGGGGDATSRVAERPLADSMPPPAATPPPRAARPPARVQRARATRGPRHAAPPAFQLPPVPASVAVEPVADTLWVGDTLRLEAAVLDSSGVPIPERVARWVPLPAGPVEVTRDGLVTAVAAGAARLTAWSGDARGDAWLLVLPVARGRVYAWDGGPAAGVRVELGAGALRLTTESAADGSFALRLPRPPGDSLTVALAPPSRALLPALLALAPPALDDSLGVVLLPSSWTIPEGRYAGRAVRITPAAALRRAGDGTRFWRVNRSDVTGEMQAVAWPPRSLPLPVVIRPSLARRTAADEGAFWATVRELEADFGMRLFRPAAAEERGAEVGVVSLELDRSLSLSGLTYISYDGRGDISEATVTVGAPGTLGDEYTIAHELVHALGVGHAASWVSLMGAAASRAARPSVEDVAYLQLLYRVRDTEHRLGARYAIPAAAAAERALAGARAAAVTVGDSPTVQEKNRR
ncbi:MAG TPA: hypothetical protein VFS05_02055 [Gemmatimonadaceae bacterium]|nr:hypothetical protein [Gemmatimonadaceae bacterium]